MESYLLKKAMLRSDRDKMFTTSVYVYVYIEAYVCMCLCVCVCLHRKDSVGVKEHSTP